jgi:hypothetical protein
MYGAPNLIQINAGQRRRQRFAAKYFEAAGGCLQISDLYHLLMAFRRSLIGD